MKKLIRLSQAIGKTLTGISEGFGTQVLMFGDEFVALEATSDRDGYCSIDDAGNVEKVLNDFCRRSLVQLGILSQEELDDRIRARARRYADDELASKRRKYEELKREFGDT